MKLTESQTEFSGGDNSEKINSLVEDASQELLDEFQREVNFDVHFADAERFHRYVQKRLYDYLGKKYGQSIATVAPKQLQEYITAAIEAARSLLQRKLRIQRNPHINPDSLALGGEWGSEELDAYDKRQD